LIPIWMDNSTGNYQLWTARIDINQLVSVESEGLLVNQFKLEQNYPNPFNSQTKIEFELPEDGFAKLEVFNSLGQRVRTLVDDFIKKGNHKIVFDAEDLPTGVYLYKLKSGNKVQARKMIYIK